MASQSDSGTNKQLEEQELSVMEESSVDSDSEKEDNLEVTSKQNTFHKIAEFETEIQAVTYLKQLNFTYYQKSGKSKLYRCANLKYRVKPQCDLMHSIKFVEPEWIVSSTNKEHSCQGRSTTQISQFPVCDEVKEVIETLISVGICSTKKVQSRLVNLKREGKFNNVIPTENQLRYYISKLKIEKFGPPQISLGELENWCRQHSVPELDLTELEDTDPFVIAYKVDYGENDTQKSFWFTITSKYLMEIAVDTDNLACDATYKLSLAGFPGVIIGTVDKNKRFHPLSLSIVSNEKEDTYFSIFEVRNNKF